MRKILAMVMMLAAVGWAQDHHSAKPDTPAWKTMQTLVGSWEGKVNEGGKDMPATVELRSTGDGSALMHLMGKGTKYEMVTMFHPDLDGMMATHYCAAHNQPRMKLVSATPTRLVFEFKDGTNIGPHDGYMAGLAINLIDADHHDEEWIYEQDGKRSTSVFHFTRVSKS